MDTVTFGNVTVSKMILGGNPFSGFSHQTPERDREMVRWYTTARIKETLRQAEALGITTFLGRADKHIRRTLMEYWDEGGEIQWLAQTAPEFNSLPGNVAGAIATGAAAVYIHGGQMDYFFAQDQLDIVRDVIQQIQDAGVAAGVAGHTPRVHQWADAHLDLDFHMCSYYNPTSRAEHAEHVHGARERFDDADRAAMVATIQDLRAPVIHYKVLAAGRNDPTAAFAFVAQHLRPQDAVCVGVFTKDNPDMLAEDVQLFETALSR
jgi:hypothetical protein